ncbi:MAG: STAS domain-containing protein [Anaerolineae bacterium]|nr:STAS domain-containing protein [Anaerolineae bacterium]MCI0609191.1 STAS domain-containing protein [Anaerolineae bacterium]
MSELMITTSQVQGEVSVTIFHLKGHLHGSTENQLLDRVRQSHEDGSKHVLLDLSELDVLSSAGLRAIHSIFNLLTPPGDVEVIRQHREEPYKSPYVKLVSPNPDIYYILNITGFLQNLLIYNNMEAAVNSFAA